jgi:hypothetical protein
MLEALWYGWFMGAVMSPPLADMFMARCRATRAVLCCFHVATRLSQVEGTPKLKAAWAGMGAVPIVLIEKILLYAELEIIESLRHSLP